MMSVSIIIPAWNEAASLKTTLHALLDIEYDKRKCEVIVVAGGDDKTYEIAKELSSTMQIFSKYVVILQKPLGKNAAFQQGIEKANKKIIVLLDADTIVSKGWLKSMVRPLEEGICDLTISNLEPIRRSWVSDFYMIRKAFFFKPYKSRLFGSIDWGIPPGAAGIGFKVCTIKDQEQYFFDSDVRVGIDHLLFKRVLEEGGRIRYIEEAIVKTYLPSSLKYFLRVELRWLTALTNIDGVNYRDLLCSITAIGALIFAGVPVYRTLSIVCGLISALFVGRKAHMFLLGSRRYRTDPCNVFGFILLSYAYHALRVVSHMRYFLGTSRQSYLSKGER